MKELYEIDWSIIKSGKCPDCGNNISYRKVNDNPWCEYCNVYFTLENNWVFRNQDALKEYRKTVPKDPIFDEDEPFVGWW